MGDRVLEIQDKERDIKAEKRTFRYHVEKGLQQPFPERKRVRMFSDHDSDKALPVALIPAYKPEPVVVSTVRQLVQSKLFRAVVLVNDGSGTEYDGIFQTAVEAGAEVLCHFVNLGKGMALRTGLNHIACAYTESVGVITLDADGQHLVKDILAVTEQLIHTPSALVLGCRKFQGDIPLRSRVGNLLTRNVMYFLAGFRVSDTQTGLRGIPFSFISHLLRLTTCGYDFELDMLISSKRNGIRTVEVPIETVYIENNRSSHFHPLLDSLKIYLVFIRFNISSLLAAVIDYAIFTLCFLSGFNLAVSMAGGRICSWIVNYSVNRAFVFKSSTGYLQSLALYMVFEIVAAIVAYLGIDYMSAHFGLNVYLAKILMESLLYVIGFTMQREIIFACPLSDRQS